MFNLKTSKSFFEYVKDIENKLGFKIEENSFDYKIFKIIYDNSLFFENNVSNHLNENLFENLQGNKLDSFLEFFNINRLSGTPNDIYEFTFMNSGNTSVLIKKDTVLMFEGNTYEVIKEEYMAQGNCIVKAIKSVDKNITSPVFTRNGVLVFEGEGLVPSEDATLETYMPGNVTLLNYKLLPAETESDYEFLERSKAVMQSFGYSNNKKIEMELIADSRIKTVIVENKGSFTSVTIIPKALKNIDDVIDYATEVVDYYKSEHIDVFKPSIVELWIEGIDSQIVYEDNYEEIIKELYIAFERYLSAFTKMVVYKNEIIKIISDVIDREGVSKAINFNNIKLNYRFYNKNNYEIPVVENEILVSKEINKTSVLSFGNIR